jgi:hypothetical protein
LHDSAKLPRCSPGPPRGAWRRWIVDRAVEIVQGQLAAEHLERVVKVVGEADDAKAGAIVVLADGVPVYLSGVDAWPAEVRGRAVRVTGTLRVGQPAPQARVSPSGEHSAGMTGSALVIESPKWELVGPM